MIRCSNRNRNHLNPGLGQQQRDLRANKLPRPARMLAAIGPATSDTPGELCRHEGASPNFGRFRAPIGGRGRQWPRLEPPAERAFQPLRHWPRWRRTIQRQAAGKQSQREFRNALDAQASRLCFRGIKQRTAPWVSASIWPMASVIPRSRSQRNMAVQRSVCRVAVIATEPRPMPSTAVTRQFTRPGRARSSTSTSSRDESSASSRRSLPCPAGDHPIARAPHWNLRDPCNPRLLKHSG